MGEVEVTAARATLILGDASDMSCVGPGEAQLVLTSPPYFPAYMDAVMAGSRSRQRDPEEAWAQLESHARSLDGVFAEIARVVGNGGLACIETKDVSFGEFRLPLSALHAAQARAVGLWVRCSFQFRSTGIKPAHLPSFVDRPLPGTFRTLDASTVMVCASTRWRPRDLPPLALSRRARLDLLPPFWRVAPARSGRIHEHQSPPALIRRLIELLTIPGDLVVDPFAGSGQTLRIARELGRNAVGYEQDADRFTRASRDLVRRGG